MADKAKAQHSITKMAFVLLMVAAVAAAVHVFTERKDWVVPPDAKARMNPVTASPATLEAARRVYGEHCVQCHGYEGRGDGREARSHRTLPADFSERAKLDAESDGELFYKISEGNRPMPSFRRRLTERQRWELVVLLRSFAQAKAAH